jgi:hypothetical protein
METVRSEFIFDVLPAKQHPAQQLLWQSCPTFDWVVAALAHLLLLLPGVCVTVYQNPRLSGASSTSPTGRLTGL